MGKDEKLLDQVLGGRADANVSFYEVIIYWSEEDAAYVAEIPELAGCMAHGKNQREALTNVRQAAVLWVKTAREFGDLIPEPKGRRLAFA